MKRLFYFIALSLLFVLPGSLKAQTYCTPTTTLGCSSQDYCDSFRTTGGLTNVAFLPGACVSGTGGFTYNTGAAGDTCTAMIGQTIKLWIYNTPFFNEGYSIWIDYDQNGTFDASERVYGPSSQMSSGGSDTLSFVIPATATPGHTRMRMRTIFATNGNTLDPCSSYTFGEAEDFDMIIIGCTGTPSAGVITTPALTSPACYGSTITIAATNPNTLGGVMFYWQQSNSVTGPWVNVTGGLGATGLTYITAPITATTYYRLYDSCIASNATAVSSVYTVPLDTATSYITVQPASAVICPGDNHAIAVTANAGVAVNYQWQVSTGGPYVNITNGGFYSGATTNSLMISAATTMLSGNVYRCILTGNCLIPVITNAVTLIVSPTVILSQPPATANTCVGGNTFFGINAIAAGIQYQWQVDTGTTGFHNLSNGGVYSGTTSSTLTFTNAYQSLNGYHYRCIVTGQCGIVASTIVSLTIGPPVTTAVATGPTSLCPGFTTTLKASIAGTATSYQWKLNGTPISGATDSFYIVNAAGVYSATVSNTQNCTNTSNTVSVSYYSLLPSAISVGGPLTFCAGSSVTLTAANAAPGISYAWKLNGVYISAATNASYVATTSGSYTLVEYDGNCYSPSSSISVVSDTVPNLSISYGGLPYFCAGDTLMLNVAPTSGLSFQWKNNNNNIGGATGTSLAVTASGSYSVKGTDNNGCSSSAPPVTITSNARPTAIATAAGPTTFCSGASVVLNANITSNYTYQWLLNGQPISGATNGSYTANAAGNYAVVVTNNVANGCSSTSSSITITVNPSPAAPVTAAGPTTFCDGNFVVLNTSSPAGQSEQWLLNGQAISSANNPWLNAYASGSYTVVNTIGSCSTTSAAITVTASPIPSDSIILYGPAIVCAGNYIQLQAIIASGQTYQWLRNGIAIPGATLDNYNATTPGQYSVQITNGGCVVYAQPVNVTVANGPTPVASFVVNTNGPRLSVAPIYVTYQWYLNGNLIPGANLPSYAPTQLGSYTVIVTDVNGCSGQSSALLVYDLTGVNNVNAGNSAIKVYPNPASSVVNIESADKVNVTISSLDGKLVMQQNSAKTIDISRLANGVYMLQVYDPISNILLKVERLVKSEQ